MNGYSMFLFLHIVGALVFFATLALEWAGLRQIRNAIAPKQAGPWMGILKNTRPIGFASMLTMVISGVYMMATVWGSAPWILVTLGSLGVVIVLSVVLTGPRMAAVGRALGQALATDQGMLSPSFHSLANHPLLSISIQTRVAITLGIVFLKVVKPDLGGSLLTIGIAIVLGLVPMLAERGRQGMHIGVQERLPERAAN
jgi:hypothetical protein